MFYKHKGCKKETICGIDCWIPPAGKGINVLTGELANVEIISGNNKKKDQVWFRTLLPKDWDTKRKIEQERQKTEDGYIDEELEDFRIQEFTRRANGLWVMINGEPVYITGLHYFYLNWWNIGIYPEYRDPDRKYFYFLLYCMLDPECLGMVEVTKRKQGKSARAGAWQYEITSRTHYAWSGIQSKTAEDAKKNIFQKYIISPFRKLPDFFKPEYDRSKGESPTSELRFYRTNRKGKHSGKEEGEELESLIDWRSSEINSYDSQVLTTYIFDEAGKLIDIDVYDLHMVARFCCEIDGQFKGKMIYTTTVEEMEAGGEGFLRLVKASDQSKKGKNGRTASGLFTFFTGAHETMFYDKYGKPDIKKGRKYHEDQREMLDNDPIAQNAYIRKNPFRLEEAFRVTQKHSMFNIIKLNNRLEVIDFMDNPVTHGNFKWKNGIRDSEVEFIPNKQGRWAVSYLPDKEKEANNVIKKNGLFYPGNRLTKVTGIDPFDHDITIDDRRSNGAAMTLNKFNSALGDKFPDFSFVCLYCARPKTAKLFYEDMIMHCFYWGSPMLFETQKIGIKNYFEERGYDPFMIRLPGAKEPGIAASKNVHQQIAELTEDYVETNIEKVNFGKLIKDWANFDINSTTKFDLAMAAGYALIADQLIVYRAPALLIESTELFRRRKVTANMC